LLLRRGRANFEAVDDARDIAHVDQAAHTVVVQHVNDLDLQIPEIGVVLKAIGL